MPPTSTTCSVGKCACPWSCGCPRAPAISSARPIRTASSRCSCKYPACSWPLPRPPPTALPAERAAEQLSVEHGVEAEVIDPRTLRPLDLDTILESVAKTNRCVIVEEGWPHGGVGANLAALISEQAFDDLDAPVMRVSGADVPMPYSKPLEESAFPHEPQIVRAALSVLGHDDPAQVPTSRSEAGDGQREGEANAPGAVQEAMQETGLEQEIRQASR